MILVIDTTRRNEVRVGLANGRFRTMTHRAERAASRQVLVLIDRLLRGQRKTPAAIKGIIVAIGPGQFSALRTACAIANALSVVLNIPVVGRRGELTMPQLYRQGSVLLRRSAPGRTIVPFYGRPPNITSPKRRTRVNR